MATQFAPALYTFDGPGTQPGRAEFSNKVRSAGGAIQAFKATYGTSDHNVLDLEARVSNVTPQGTGVTYDVTFNFRDDSDNKGFGEVSVLIIADVES